MKGRLWLVCAVGAIYLMAACAAPQTKTEKGAVYGTATGAAVGAIVGQAIGHDTRGTLTGAAIGAAVGGLAGAGIGHMMDKQEQDLRQAIGTSEAASIQREGQILAVTFKSDMLFSTNSATVQPGAYSEIDRLAQILNQYPDTTIRIEGYTDNTGSEQYNLDLSQRRADAVKQLLVARGVNPMRMVTVGFGESRPVASNDTAAGRQMNRRVTVYIEPRR